MQVAKLPMDCGNLNEIRQGSDAVDRGMIRLVQRPLGYGLTAAQPKPDEASIPAPDRVVARLIDHRHWAGEEQLGADLTFQAID
ncbi:hypothetical protein [uncultured Microbulbifer sp.]|uniref:hypothetical protein n=1 Tax=uncultured Microbulbifer sp. TaxID=348147 RepID=UPI00261AB71A|nr:hypothetical protein [uncultured Microbulbifer sp.]